MAEYAAARLVQHKIAQLFVTGDKARCQIASNRDPFSRPIMTPRSVAIRDEKLGLFRMECAAIRVAQGGRSPTEAREWRRALSIRGVWGSRVRRRSLQVRFLNRQLVLPVSIISQ